jgi:hypothetical protein
MAKLVLADVSGIFANPNSAQNTLNDNADAIEAAVENTLSRDGTTPNQMLADFDLNHNDILNGGTVNATGMILNGVAVNTTLPGFPLVMPGDLNMNTHNITGATNISGTGNLTIPSAAITNLAATALTVNGVAPGTVYPFNVGTGANNIIQLNGSALLPAVDGSQLTNLPGQSGRLLAIQKFPSSGTYTKTAGANKAVVIVQAGGGAGGGALVTTSGNVSIGGHGASGSWGILENWTIVSPQTVTIGAGGTGGTGSGGAGGATTFGAVVSTSGGSGGGVTGATPVATSTTASGGQGGAVATGGDINVTGQSAGNPLLLNSVLYTGPGGAASYFGGGARGLNVAGAGNAAVSPGSGGGGAVTIASAAQNGGNGAAGYVLIFEYS